MVMSMIIEHKGWLGSPKIKVKKEKIIAVALMIVSLVLIY
jgi:bacterial/archaeal transporter family-2 protein